MIRICLIFGVFILLSNVSLSAQRPTKLDSLLAVNQNYARRDTNKLKTLLAISHTYSNQNPQKGLATADACISIAEELGIPLFLGRSYFMKSLNLFQMSKLDSTIIMVEQAIAIFERLDLKEDLGKAYTVRGGVSYYRADYPAAESNWEKAAEAYRIINDLPGQARMMANLGLIYLTQKQHQKALDVFKAAAAIQEKTELWGNLSNSYAHIASVYLTWQDYDMAFTYYQKALDLAKKVDHKIFTSIYLGNIGNVYFNKSDYPNAITWYQEAIKLNEELGNKQTHANNLLTLSILYSNLRDFPQAIKYIEKATQLAKEMGNQNMLGRCLDNLGTQYRKMEDLTKAESYFMQANDIYEAVNFKDGICDVSLSLGYIHMKYKDYAKSISYFQKAKGLSDIVAGKSTMVTSLDGLANNCMYAPDSLLMPMLGIQAENRYSEAIRLLLEAQEMARAAKILFSEQSTWRTLSQAYELKGDYVNAYKAFSQFVAIRDSVVGEDTKKQITRKEIQYEFDKKEATLKFEQQLTQEQLEQQKLLSFQQQQSLQINQQSLALSNKEKDLQHLAYLKEKAEKQEKEQALSLAEKDKQLQDVQLGSLLQEKALQLKTLAEKNALIGFLIAGLSAILLAFAAFYWWIRQRQAKKEAAIQAQFTRQLLENIEDDRGRIAIDLHDSVSHDLLLLKQSIRKEITGPEVGDKIDNIINGIRQISRNLHPVMLDKIGLRLSLETLCEQFMQHETMYVSHEIEYQNTLPKTAELQLFRIVQEGLTNALKYSKAEAVKVQFKHSGTSLRLEIQDNGKGFEVEKALEGGKAFGLHSILQRAKAIGGKAEIRSGEGGTTVSVVIGV